MFTAEDLEKILGLLHQHTGVDFTHYKQATLRRRIERRMNVHKILSVNAYCRFLRTQRQEIEALFNDILIQVTSFFRDSSVFKALRIKHLPQMLRSKKADDSIRIWVPACSTGEELYSLAIILTELIEAKSLTKEIQIFGTDINELALAKARAGTYPSSISKQVSPERLRRFFEPGKDTFTIRKQVRDLCIFARHDLASDPPFIHTDLISCRNALIYMNPVLQAKIMTIFNFALKPSGLLLLGSSETTGSSPDLFAIQDRKINLFTRKARTAKPVSETFLPASSTLNRSAQTVIRKAAFANPKKLNPAGLKASVERIIKNHAGNEGMGSHVVPITLPGKGEKAYLVFGTPEKTDRQKASKPSKTTPGKAKNSEAENVRLRKELFEIRQTVELIIEQQEASNEELRAANEEVIASNEELQSTNEELETAKEELQATNGELATVNGELENRNLELEGANVITSHFKAIVDSSDDAIISKDLHGIIHTWNKGAENIFGYAADEVIGQPVTILFPPKDVDEEPKILALIRAGERIEHYETTRIRKDGKTIDISLTVSPIKNNGQIVGASKIARDITEKKRAELELRQARDEAERASRAKDNFLATLSHELRTPLNPVLLLASDAITDPKLPADMRANFELILKNVELEAKLIDDLLDLARINTGKLKVEKSHVNLFSILSATIAIMQRDIDQKKISLVQAFDDTHSIILGDDFRLQQVFWNVLRNAIKFTPSGGEITIETSSTLERCIVKISDTGIGMSLSELARVFDAFKQGDHSLESHRFGGLGLGLTISKNLIGLHSGTIEAFSEGRGKGSSFTLTFPLAKGNGVDAKATPPSNEISGRAPRSGLRILLVDDHEPTRSTLARLLRNRHHEVIEAASASEALSLGEKSQFHLVISDIGLPDGNGYDLFKTIRKHSPNAKGIALSGFGMEKDLAQSKDSGFFLHLTKPVKIDALDAALACFSEKES